MSGRHPLLAISPRSASSPRLSRSQSQVVSSNAMPVSSQSCFRGADMGWGVGHDCPMTGSADDFRRQPTPRKPSSSLFGGSFRVRPGELDDDNTTSPSPRRNTAPPPSLASSFAVDTGTGMLASIATGAGGKEPEQFRPTRKPAPQEVQGAGRASDVSDDVRRARGMKGALAPTPEEVPITPKPSRRLFDAKENNTPLPLEKEMGRRQRRSFAALSDSERAGSPTFKAVHLKEEKSLADSLGRKGKNSSPFSPSASQEFADAAGAPSLKIDRERPATAIGKAKVSSMPKDAAGSPSPSSHKNLMGGVWRLDEDPALAASAGDLYGHFRARSVPVLALRGGRACSPIF